MIQQTFKDFEISPDAILNKEFPGFEQDYLVLDSLLRKYNPKSVFEIGTNFGSGTNIICNALPNSVVYSLDLPVGMGDKPLYQHGQDYTGINCKFAFTQLRGDSTDFDYSRFPAECYYVDGNHTYFNVMKETEHIQEQSPNLIIYHDSDIPEVFNAIKDCMKVDDRYELYRVTDTRISYLLRK